DERALGERAVKFSQELPEPGSLCDAVGDSPVLGLSTGARDDWLPLGRPRDKIATQEDSVAGRGPASVWTPSPVNVGVDNKLGAGRPVKKKAVVHSAPKVAEET